MAEGLLLILSGPSGVGKGTVCRALLAQLPRLKLSVSVTTRRPRPGEEEGREYHFISPSRFQELIEAEAFLEWAMVHGQYYGTLKSKVRSRDRSPVGNRRPGCSPGKTAVDDAVTILWPPSMEALKNGSPGDRKRGGRSGGGWRWPAGKWLHTMLMITWSSMTVLKRRSGHCRHRHRRKCKASCGACPNF